MQLEGSCHCGAVRFRVESRHPHPFNLCYCRTCRKTAGSGGHAINLSGEKATLRIEGGDHLRVYKPGHVDEHDGTRSPQERSFCGTCGSPLWVFDPRWPDLVHPHASAVDTTLPIPPRRNHLMLDFKAPWVALHLEPDDRTFPRYPDLTIAEWHEELGLVDEE